MERTLVVTGNNGYLFAELVFDYDTVTGGLVIITTYAPQVLEPAVEGVYPVIPTSRYSLPFVQTPVDSIAGIKVFDIEFFIQYFSENIPAFAVSNYRFSYNTQPMAFRYLVQYGDTLLGIANIMEHFIDNNKQLQWISVKRMKEDQLVNTDSLENNVLLLERLIKQWETTAAPILKKLIS